MKQSFAAQGARWTDGIEKKVKLAVAHSIPDTIGNIDEVVIPQKSGFLSGLAATIERMISE